MKKLELNDFQEQYNIYKEFAINLKYINSLTAAFADSNSNTQPRIISNGKNAINFSRIIING